MREKSIEPADGERVSQMAPCLDRSDTKVEAYTLLLSEGEQRQLQQQANWNGDRLEWLTVEAAEALTDGAADEQFKQQMQGVLRALAEDRKLRAAASP